MADGDVVLFGHPLSDQRAVAGRGVLFDAEQGRDTANRQSRHDRREVDVIEDLGEVAAGVLGGKLSARALADAEAVILGVLSFDGYTPSEIAEILGMTPAAVNALLHRNWVKARNAAKPQTGNSQ